MKKILSALAVVVGAASFWAFGGSARYYKGEIRGPATIYITEKATKVFIGDTGENTEQRVEILKSLVRDCNESTNGFYLFMLGDYGYPKGVNNDSGYLEHIEPFTNLCENHILTFGIPGNHEKYKLFPNAYMAKRFHGKEFIHDGAFVQENYYYKLVEQGEMSETGYLQNCYFLIDSSPWDSPFQSGIKDRITAWLKFESKECDEKNLLSHHYFFSSSDRKPSSAWLRFYENVIVPLGFKRVISGHDHLIHYTVRNEIEHYISGMGAKTTKNPVGYLKSSFGKYEFKILGNNMQLEEEEGEE